MKLLIVGCGGIGSYLSELLFECIETGQLDAEVTLMDNDIVEVNQIRYQNFYAQNVGKPKCLALADRYAFKYINERLVTTGRISDGYDLIILCVDNNKARKVVWDSGEDFIDLRATGRRIAAIPKCDDYAKYLDDDPKEYSCQDKADLDKGWIQLGNRVVAAIGCQMVLNHSRRYKNRAISLLI
jgi:hypothetical protein